MSKLEISIKSEELVAAILRLAGALEGQRFNRAEREASAASSVDSAAAPATVQDLTKAQVTLEQIRAVLAAKSLAGGPERIRDLLGRYGAGKLTEVDAAKYPELFREAESL